MDREILDLAVVGAGPAGMTAALYAARGRMRCVVFEKKVPGGQIALTEEIENYPGIPSISGPELAEKMKRQAEEQGAYFVMAEVEGVVLPSAAGEPFILRTGQGEWRAWTVVVASGSRPRSLGVPGERELVGRGVSYCAACDGPFFQGKRVVVVGGGDSAFQEGLFLTRMVEEVLVVHRRSSFRAQPVLVERLQATGKASFLLEAVVEEILGRDKVEGVRVRSLRDGQRKEIPCAAVFPYIGHVPETEFLPPEVKRDGEGRVRARENTCTSVEGLFAAGDVRPKPLRQIVTAMADGATAAMAAEQYLSSRGQRP